MLDAHIEPEDNTRDRYALPFFSRSTLKGYRNSQGWYLPGQSKAAAAERNKVIISSPVPSFPGSDVFAPFQIAMREYVSTLASRVGHPSLFTRSLFVFEQAMERGHYKYGRKARLVAGASLAVALREAHKGETIKDIAVSSTPHFIHDATLMQTYVSISLMSLRLLLHTSSSLPWTFLS